MPKPKNSDESASSVQLLTAAIIAGDLAIATALIEEGVSVRGRDQTGHYPIYVAARDGKAEMVRLLASYGVNIDAPIYASGERPLYLAAAGGHLDTVRALLHHGAMVDAPGPAATALLTCVQHLANESLNVPDKTRWRSDQSRHPRGLTAVAEALIHAGADVNSGSGTSETPADLIRYSGVYRLVSLLEGREKPRPKRSFWSELFGG